MAKKSTVKQKAAKRGEGTRERSHASKKRHATEAKLGSSSLALRERAEQVLHSTSSDFARMSLEDVQALVHELQLHQIELDLQNENLREAQLELERSRDRYSDLYNFAPVGYLTLDRNDTILEANLTAATLLEVERARLVGARLTQFIGRQNRHVWHQHRESAFSNPKTQTAEMKLQLDDGSVRWVGLGSVVLDTDNDRQRQCRTVLIDITETILAREFLQLRETLEQRVSEQTSEIRLLAQSIASLGEGVMITRDHLDWPESEIVFANEAMSRITGYEISELVGQTPRILSGQRTDEKVIEQLRGDLSNGRPCLAQLTHYRKSETAYDAELFITPLFNADQKRTHFVSVYRDITERKQAEEAIRQSEAFARSVLGSLLAHIAVLDDSGEIIAVNPAWDQFASENGGILIRCGVGANYLEICYTASGPFAENASAAAAGIESVMNGTWPTFTLEYPCHSPQQPRWFLMHVSPLSGGLRGVVVSHVNITARRQAEIALRDAHDFSDQLINTARTIVLVLDTEGRIVRMNPYFEELSGWRLADVQGQDWFNTFLPESDRPRIRKLFTRSLGGKRTHGNVNSIVTRDGKLREIEWYDAALANVEGEQIGLLCTGQDITEREEIERQLRIKDQAIASSAAGIVIADPDGTISYANPTFAHMWGYDHSDQITGRSAAEFSSSDPDLGEVMEGLRARGSWVGERVAKKKDGSLFDVQVAASVVPDRNGRIICMMASFIDISLQKKLQRQIVEVAQEEDRRIGQELHDNIQQQLTGLELLTSGLRHSLQERSAPESSLADRISHELSKTSEQVHLLSRGLVPVEVDADGLRSALSELASRIDQQHGVRCQFYYEGMTELADNFVATHLYRMAQEAITNAVKHANPQQIDLSLIGSDDSIQMLVRDDGIGISPEQMDARLGIGLPIMRYRADMIGATLHIGLSENGGTFVSCTIANVAKDPTVCGNIARPSRGADHG